MCIRDRNVAVTNPLPIYDSAPGGIRSTIGSDIIPVFDEILDGAEIDFHKPNHCFIPAVSALDVKGHNGNLSFNIAAAKNAETLDIPFDDYTAPKILPGSDWSLFGENGFPFFVNEPHVFFIPKSINSDGNGAFVDSRLQEVISNLPSELNETYNFGFLRKRITDAVSYTHLTLPTTPYV